MKKAIKKLALVAAILSCALSVNAQDDFSTLYGTYAGSMSTTVFSEQNPDGIPLALKDVRFDLSKGEANFYTLTLKDYSMANKFHFADIPLTDNLIIKDGADWKIEQVNNAYGQYQTSDDKYLVTLVISMPNQESNKISATGQMDLSLVVLYKETKIEHVFNGEKAEQNYRSSRHYLGQPTAQNLLRLAGAQGGETRSRHLLRKREEDCLVEERQVGF
jgi:hypothetical protein